MRSASIEKGKRSEGENHQKKRRIQGRKGDHCQEGKRMSFPGLLPIRGNAKGRKTITS